MFVITFRDSGWNIARVAILTLLVVAQGFGDPRIDNLGPPVATSGATATIHFYGVELLDPQDVILYSPRMQLLELDAYDDRHVAARIRVQEDCPPGIYPFRLVTGRGVSNMRSLAISNLPVVEEKEPNNQPAQTQVVAIPCTVYGRIQSEDVEYIGIDLQQGQTICIETLGIRLGRELCDYHLSVQGPGGQLLIQADDHLVTRQDPVCFLTAPETGRYTIQLRDVRYSGNNLFLYALSIGEFPRPSYAWPPGGRPGEELDIQWLTPGQPAWTQRVRLPKSESEYHSVAPIRRLHARNEKGTSPTPNQLRVLDLPGFAESEPNNTHQQPSAMDVPGVAYGVINEPGDIDFFGFQARKGQPLEIRVVARKTLRSPLDAVLAVRDVNNKQLVANDDAGSPDSFVDFNPPADGEYRILIRDHLRQGGEEYLYRVEVSPRTPRLIMGTPDRQQFVSTTLGLPRNGRMALLVSGQRRHYNEPIELAFENLPAGVTVEAPPIPKGRDRVPVVFQVAADASRCGELVGIAGKSHVGDREIQGQFLQRTILVRGQNNRDVWGHDADRIAVAVKDESPFSIEIIEPQVPIVRNGQMELKVVARREPAYQGPIALRMMLNPPGLYARAVSIPKDVNEASMTITANGGAAIASSPIVITGSANVGGARHEVCSQLVHLRVEDSYFGVKFAKSNVEQGGETTLIVNLERKREIKDPVTAELVGLPAGTSSHEVQVGAEQKELAFKIKAEEKARPGRHNTVICRLVVTENGEPVTHLLGRGQLRVDKPLPPKKSEQPAEDRVTRN